MGPYTQHVAFHWQIILAAVWFRAAWSAFSRQLAASGRISPDLWAAWSVALGSTTSVGCLLTAAIMDDTEKRTWNLT